MKKLILVLMLLPFVVLGQTTGEATVTWIANTESDLAGYKVYISENSVANGDSSAYKVMLDIGNKLTHTWPNLRMGDTYYFAVAAYDSSGNLSDYSEEVSHFLKPIQDTTPPGAPKGVEVEITIKLKVGGN